MPVDDDPLAAGMHSKIVYKNEYAHDKNHTNGGPVPKKLVVCGSRHEGAGYVQQDIYNVPPGYHHHHHHHHHTIATRLPRGRHASWDDEPFRVWSDTVHICRHVMMMVMAMTDTVHIWRHVMMMVMAMTDTVHIWRHVMMMVMAMTEPACRHADQAQCAIRFRYRHPNYDAVVIIITTTTTIIIIIITGIPTMMPWSAGAEKLYPWRWLT